MDDINLDALLRPAYRDQEERIARHLASVPALSPAASKLIQISSQLNPSPGEIVATIRLDPILSARVLEIVNSAYFSPAEKVVSLQRAVVVLGINTIKNLALSCAVIDLLGSKKGEIQKLIHPVWMRSIASAVASRIIAKIARLTPQIAEETFLCALLHLVGKIVLIQIFPEIYSRGGMDASADEKSAFGVTRFQVTSMLLCKWNFPEKIVETSSFTGRSGTLGALEAALSLSTSFAPAVTDEVGLDSVEFDQAALATLALSADAIGRELDNAKAHLSKATAFLS
jgi:HD-like signal output (HDOD) protein